MPRPKVDCAHGPLACAAACIAWTAISGDADVDFDLLPSGCDAVDLAIRSRHEAMRVTLPWCGACRARVPDPEGDARFAAGRGFVGDAPLARLLRDVHARCRREHDELEAYGTSRDTVARR